jgi:hypothetical protein
VCGLPRLGPLVPATWVERPGAAAGSPPGGADPGTRRWTPARSPLESWRKWSFPSGLPGHGGAGPPGWVVVGKSRRSSWFPPASHPDLAQARPPTAVAGCLAELTEIWVRGEAWWSVGFEATGPVRLLRGALEHAVGRVFARAVPPGVQFSLGNSRSYAHWLGQRPAWPLRAQPE